MDRLLVCGVLMVTVGCDCFAARAQEVASVVASAGEGSESGTTGPGPAIAEAKPEPTIVTDRPSFSDGTGIVPAWRLQLETGWTYTYRDDDSARTDRHNFPEVLARVGLIDNRWELRFLTSGYNWADVDAGGAGGSTDVDGWSDVAIGTKLRLTDQSGLLPSIAVSATVTIPSGSEEYSSRHWDPIFKFIWNYDLGSGFGLGGNLNANFPSVRGGDHWEQFQGSIYLTYAPRSDLSFFLEYYAITELTDGGPTGQSIDLGGAYLLTNKVQLDARVGFGLNDDSDDFFVGAGVSFLF
jgi:hypothetical protein